MRARAANADITLLDFGMGNIRSLQKAFEFLGAHVTVTEDAARAAKSDVLLLPGDGAFVQAMRGLKNRQLDEAIWEAHQKQKIIFGICIGFQIFFESSTEFGAEKGLGLVKGKITRLKKNTEAKWIPHVGWTTTDFLPHSILGKNIEPHSMFYYVHSFANHGKHEFAAATTNYGQLFTSALEHENLFAVQFHPEKSHTAGLTLIKNFLECL
ncbi:MAG: Imidazole glycerol phosphate synthase subunit HisH [Turneriella sp.]|nr:Imidazole glycerol phosphate synthase subunit HisH [Turneriella sp.]